MDYCSPVSDDGRGLKQGLDAAVLRQRRSPVSDDGRGLKLQLNRNDPARLQGSPVSDDGRGLKPSAGVVFVITRGSPVSDDGRGLKRAFCVYRFARSPFARQR